MDGETLNFGSCGAVKGVKYPISLASQICLDHSLQRPCQLIPPTTLVGAGATAYAKKSNLALIDNKKLISKRARSRYKKTKSRLRFFENGTDASSQNSVIYEKLDTVGAVCVDSRGHVASACSSGGLSMKYDGRIGQAATYAAGVWADSSESSTKRSVAVSTTGAGEYIVKTLLAKELGTKIKESSSPALAFHKCMKEDFLGEKKYIFFLISRHLHPFMLITNKKEALFLLVDCILTLKILIFIGLEQNECLIIIGYSKKATKQIKKIFSINFN